MMNSMDLDEWVMGWCTVLLQWELLTVTARVLNLSLFTFWVLWKLTILLVIGGLARLVKLMFSNHCRSINSGTDRSMERIPVWWYSRKDMLGVVFVVGLGSWTQLKLWEKRNECVGNAWMEAVLALLAARSRSYYFSQLVTLIALLINQIKLDQTILYCRCPIIAKHVRACILAFKLRLSFPINIE